MTVRFAMSSAWFFRPKSNGSSSPVITYTVILRVYIYTSFSDQMIPVKISCCTQLSQLSQINYLHDVPIFPWTEISMITPVSQKLSKRRLGPSVWRPRVAPAAIWKGPWYYEQIWINIGGKMIVHFPETITIGMSLESLRRYDYCKKQVKKNLVLISDLVFQRRTCFLLLSLQFYIPISFWSSF